MSRVTHFELPADDPERSIRFYEKAFGWKVSKWDGPVEYWLISTGDDSEPGIHGGLAQRATPQTGVELTLEIQDLDAAVTRVIDQGGKLLRPRAAVPGIGWMAYIQDTEGNIFGLMEIDSDAA